MSGPLRRLTQAAVLLDGAGGLRWYCYRGTPRERTLPDPPARAHAAGHHQDHTPEGRARAVRNLAEHEYRAHGVTARPAQAGFPQLEDVG